MICCPAGLRRELPDIGLPTVIDEDERERLRAGEEQESSEDISGGKIPP